MTTLNIELLDALRAAHVEEDLARRAAASVPTREVTANLVAKTDLEQFRTAFRADSKADFSEFTAEIKVDFSEFTAEIKVDFSEFTAEIWKWQATHVKWTIATLVAMTAIFGVIVKLF